jgi:alanyl-tRNA synthetase
MTEHLYYHDSFLYEFDADVLGVTAVDSRPAVILDRTAFYPTSGGQVFDTGWIVPAGHESVKMRVADVAEQEDGTILHFLDAQPSIQRGTRIRGLIDAERRRDHMQQHSGQHVLSAAFVRTLNMPTVSFHMGVESCSIDLDTKSLSNKQAEVAEALANDVVTENRGVGIRFVTSDEAKDLGLRKLPPTERDQLRLIDIHDFDLTACGGTHVTATGQIGCILLRKIEKVRQGWRVEFVCGKRAVGTARRDYTALAESAGLLSAHVWDVPLQIQKLQDESRTLKKSVEHTSAEIADLYAVRILAETSESGGRKVVVRLFPDRDLVFIKLLAQRLTRQSSSLVALLGAGAESPSIVFAQSVGQPFDMGALMKEALAKLGGRGGGSKDMAQGGTAHMGGVEAELKQIAARLGENRKQ